MGWKLILSIMRLRMISAGGTYSVASVAILLISLVSWNPANGFQPPVTGMAAPPVVAVDPAGGFDPTWVSHRGQVLLILYVGSSSEVPPETIQRISDWQERLHPQGFQAVLILEDKTPPAGLHPEVIVAQDQKGMTRKLYQITEDREYFVVDRYGRLRRQKINEQLIQKALNERFDPSWVGYSGAWNQTYFVHRGDILFYLADTLPEKIKPGEAFDVRLIALPTYSVPKPGAEIHKPVLVEVRTDGSFQQETYKAELNEPIQVSTEMLLQVVPKNEIEPGQHVLWVHVRHEHCGFANCGGYEQTIPLPVWVE
jgi:hypothetical protein